MSTGYWSHDADWGFATSVVEGVDILEWVNLALGRVDKALYRTVTLLTDFFPLSLASPFPIWACCTDDPGRDRARSGRRVHLLAVLYRLEDDKI